MINDSKLDDRPIIVINKQFVEMKFLKRLIILELLAFLLFTASCKTKQEIVQESQFENEINERNEENKKLFEESGLDSETIDALSEELKALDEQLMNFLATDPDAEARSEMLRKIASERNTKLRNSMTEEEYNNYLKAQKERQLKKSKTLGAPKKKR